VQFGELPEDLISRIRTLCFSEYCEEKFMRMFRLVSKDWKREADKWFEVCSASSIILNSILLINMMININVVINTIIIVIIIVIVIIVIVIIVIVIINISIIILINLSIKSCQYLRS
jgi:hypothetical protein